MSFFSIIDVESINKGLKPVDLEVTQKNGIDVTPDTDIVINKLNDGNKSFLNNGYGGISFKISVIIHKNEFHGNMKVTDCLHDWIINLTPIYVVTDAIDITNGKYIITKNSYRKQSYLNYTVWELEFTEFKSINIVKYKNDNRYVNKAKKNYEKLKAQSRKKSKKAKANNTNKNKLKKCKLSNLKYGQKKSKCVKYAQKILYKKGYLTKKQIDGWFGPKTKNAIKRFQKKYKKKYKLKITGKIDKATFKALIDV